MSIAGTASPERIARGQVSLQPSALLASLFEAIDPEQPLTVLDFGPAVPETVEFLSRFRCRLHVLDLFSELPIEAGEEGSAALQARLDELMDIPQGTRFDICLFWDLFNYLGRDAILALISALRPYLRPGTMAHALAAHNVRVAQNDRYYGIAAPDALSVRQRVQPLAGYEPHAQDRLKNMLYCFNVARSVLLSDGRLELVLRAKQ